MKKETLKEVLKKYQGREVKLGSRSNFVYCGNVSDDISDILNRCSTKHYEIFKTRLENKLEYKKNFKKI